MVGLFRFCRILSYLMLDACLDCFRSDSIARVVGLAMTGNLFLIVGFSNDD